MLYFIAFILLVGFFVLNMFVGVVVENFHRCREEQEKEEKIRRAAKRAIQLEKKRRRMHEPPYYTNYSPLRMFVHNVVTSKYFDLAIAAVIGLNVVTMAMEYYMMPLALEYALKIFNYFFTAVFILEAVMKLVALGFKLYLKDKWNQLDVFIVILSIVGIVLEELETKIIPINPTIIRVMRVLRIARVLKLLKMARGIRALLDTVMQALPQVTEAKLLWKTLINLEISPFSISRFAIQIRSVTWGYSSFCCSSYLPLSESSCSDDSSAPTRCLVRGSANMHILLTSAWPS